MPPEFNPNAYGRPPPRPPQKTQLTTKENHAIIDSSQGIPIPESNTIYSQYPILDLRDIENNQAAITPLEGDGDIPASISAVVPERIDRGFVSTNQNQTSTDQIHIPLTQKTLSSVPDSNLTIAEFKTQHCLQLQFSSNKDKLRDRQVPAQQRAFTPNLQGRDNIKSVYINNTKQAPSPQTDTNVNPAAATNRPDPNASKMPRLEKSNSVVARGDRLKILQDASLRKITRKSAARKGDDTNNSVSMRDLDLARAPVNANEPESSVRRWAHDSPSYEGALEKDIDLATFSREDLSMLPRVPSTRASCGQTAAMEQSASVDARRARWAVKDEMKAEKADTNSNAWGSEIPSDATRPSNLSDESFGKLLRSREPAADELLHDWEGNLMPPPADWAERPRYNNNNAEYRGQFRQYIGGLQARFSNGVPIVPVSTELLRNQYTHPDGIGMVHRTVTIDFKNAARYGYIDQLQDTLKYAEPISSSDYDIICQLDSDDEGNAQFDREETTDKLVTNWNLHAANARRESIDIGSVSRRIARVAGEIESSEVKADPIQESSSMDEDEDEAAPLAVPKLNIYLRPGTKADLSELTRIYNWYVNNGSQTAELRELHETGMQDRMQFCADSKLPFIVAAMRSQKGARPVPRVDDEEVSRRRQLPVTHKQPMALTRIENLAGFCCANDFTQPDFVEHTTADIEVYVDAQYRRMGVGKSLLDKMLEICDRGHRLTMDVPFHCDARIRHLYGPGGNRDLHKMSILLRKWHLPKAAAINLQVKRKSKKLALVKTQENDYGLWLKDWLASLGFEVEGCLTKMGAKNGRYIDLVYLGRETSWEPPDGKVPDPIPEFMSATIADEADDGW